VAEQLIPHVIESLIGTGPLLIMIFGAMAVLVADVLLPRDRRPLLSVISLVVVALAFWDLHMVGSPGGSGSESYYFGALRANSLVFLAQNVILGGAFFLILIAPRYLDGKRIPLGEFYALLLIAVTAMLALAASTELLTLFLNIELLSITLYVLVGIENRNSHATEAAFKYFLLGSVAAAFLLFGIAFVFGATGQTRYDRIAEVIAAGGIVQPAFLAIGLGLMLVGFGFKLSLAPFHMYAPDVYEGAPTPIAAAVATGSKVAALGALFHLIELASGWSDAPAGLWAALYAITLISMIVGNVGAIIQPNFLRMMAYSSISHSAYAVVPMVVLLRRPDLLIDARDAVGYYMLAYTIMTLLAFGVATILGRQGEGRIASYAGLGRRAPLLAALMALAMLSLLGIPPAVGFFGKLRLFAVAVEGGHYWLAVIGVLSSVASAYYYLRVIVTMYMQEPAEGAEPAIPTLDRVNAVALSVCSACLFVFAIFQGVYLFGS